MNRLFLASLVGPFVVGLTSCAATQRPASATLSSKPAEDAEAVRTRMRVWEPGTFPKHAVSFEGGQLTAEVESKTAPEVECTKKGDSPFCNVTMNLGKDPAEEDRSVACSILWSGTPLPMGVLVESLLQKYVITGDIAFDVEWKNEGLAVHFVAPTKYEDESTLTPGMEKVLVHYGPGRTVVCADLGAGNQKGFERVAAGFLDSMKVKQSATPFVFQGASRRRTGDRTTGFNLAYVVKGDDNAFEEKHLHFGLVNTSNTWGVHDYLLQVDRKESGAPTSYKSTTWHQGSVGTIYSGRPAEGGKWRLKVESNGKSDAIEITPQAVVSTELWEAPSVARVATGAKPSHRYAFPTSTDEGEPGFGYANLTRLGPGVVIEKPEMPEKKKSKEPEEKNELSVSASGVVTKQVSAEYVIEQIHVEGALPVAGVPSKRKDRR